MLATAVAYSGTYAATHQAAAPKEPALVAPDPQIGSAEHEGGQQAEGARTAIYTNEPQDGYVVSFFDGHGGVAGVPMTEEQRHALIKEATRRGMSEEQAYALAYGPNQASATVEREGEIEEGADEETGQEATLKETAAAPGARLAKKTDGDEAPVSHETYRILAPLENEIDSAHEEGADEGDDDALHHALELLPEGVRDVIQNVLPFQSFMRELAGPGFEPVVDIDHDPEAGTVSLTAASRLSPHVEVTAQVVAPVSDADSESASASEPIVTVTVTNPVTNEVLAESEPAACEGVTDVPRVAIGEVVETVIAASDSAPQGEGHKAVSEVQEAANTPAETASSASDTALGELPRSAAEGSVTGASLPSQEAGDEGPKR
ncbi:hypothetical protein [Streptomyces sp. NPDC006134]|uniref:hypothetical protein n=1 Tax=Streptomyces sp. NPDC006134 TaxID=3154467 RepID=UPI00340721FD